MRSIGESDELGLRAILEALLSHFGHEESVADTPEDARGNPHRAVGKRRAMAEGGAVPVDHCGERAGLRPRGVILGQIVRRKSARAAGADERGEAVAEAMTPEESFWQERKLEEKHVPALAQLAAIFNK